MKKRSKKRSFVRVFFLFPKLSNKSGRILWYGVSAKSDILANVINKIPAAVSTSTFLQIMNGWKKLPLRLTKVNFKGISVQINKATFISLIFCLADVQKFVNITDLYIYFT